MLKHGNASVHLIGDVGTQSIGMIKGVVLTALWQSKLKWHRALSTAAPLSWFII